MRLVGDSATPARPWVRRDYWEDTTLRFMLIRRADESTERGDPPSAELFEAMTKYNEELVQAGAMVDGAGLMPTSEGARVRFAEGKAMVVDAPFIEAKELIAGYTMIKADSLAEAVEWARKWPPLDGDGEVTIEVRQVFEIEDFGEEMTPELREQNERIRAETSGT